jgi:parallel beta-helix repeat protein
MKKRYLVIGIILSLVCLSITPSTAVYNIKESSTPIFNGNTLYVGGIGPDNYTRIQDAIDNAVDGDTVFVYDDSSPYLENILVNKSIKLIGENKDTTIIDGRNHENTILIVSDNVYLYGFCIQNSGYHFNESGVFVESSGCSINTNLIKENKYGIFLNKSSNNCIYENLIIDNSVNGLYMYLSSDNIVSMNTFIANNWSAVTLENSSNNTFSYNIINNSNKYDTFIGVDIYKSTNNTINNNYISNNDGCGINIDESHFNQIYKNNIINNTFSGVHLRFSSNNYIYQNNFIDNYYHNAVFSIINISHCKNIWKNNYWNRPRLLLKPILGFRILVLKNSTVVLIPCLPNFDWHPAKEPYDI